MRCTLGVIALLVLLTGCGSRRHAPAAAQPASKLMAPPGSSLKVQPIPASSGEPAELVVTWHRDSRNRRTFGASVWVLRRTTWRREYDRRYVLNNAEPIEDVVASIGDGTGDGHADVVIVPVTNGSGGCSEYHVIALLSGRLREVLTRINECESANVTPNHGDLLVSHTVGPCPGSPEPAHCYGGTETDRLRWTGQGYVRVGSIVECRYPQLNPARGCRR